MEENFCKCGRPMAKLAHECRRCYLASPTHICVSTWKPTKNKELIKKDLEIFDRLRGER